PRRNVRHSSVAAGDKPPPYRMGTVLGCFVGKGHIARLIVSSLTLLSAAAACGPGPTSRTATDAGEAPRPAATRTLTMATRNEPASIAGKPLKQANVGLYTIKAMFDASLAVLDEKALPRPRLAEAL